VYLEKPRTVWNTNYFLSCLRSFYKYGVQSNLPPFIVLLLFTTPSRPLEASQTPASHITRPVQLQSRQITMQCYEYIAGDNWAASPTRGLYIKQQHDANIAGDRRKLGDLRTLINSGQWTMVDHVPNTVGAIGEVDDTLGIQWNLDAWSIPMHVYHCRHIRKRG
jgi:hypothetical protein